MKRKTFRQQLERGNSALVFGMGLILMMAAFAGYLYDVRRVALAQIHAQNTLDLAAHKAGSSIDIPRYKVQQDVALSAAAPAIALSTIASARKTEYSLSISSVQMMNGGAYMVLRGSMTVPLGFLSRAFGLTVAKRSFTTVVEPSYGIQKKND